MTTYEPGGRSVPPSDDHNDHIDDTATMRVCGAQQLLALLPQLIGYHPDHSLVLVLTATEGRPGPWSRPARVLLSCRLDLPPLQDLTVVADLVVPALRQAISEDPDEVRLLHVFGYDVPEEPDGQLDPHLVAGLRAAMTQVAEHAGAHLHDLFLVRHRGRSVREVVESGRELDPLPDWAPAVDVSQVPAAADLTLRGVSALGSREELVALVRRRDRDAAAATTLALSLQAMQPPPDYLEGLQLLAAWVVHGQQPTARERAVITQVLADRWARDVLLARWIPGTFVLSDVLDESATRHLCRVIPAWASREPAGGLDRLLILVSQVPKEHTAPLLTVTGLLAWSAGVGTIANEACDLALEVDRDYVMAQLLSRTLAHGVRPPRAHPRGGRPPGPRPDRRPAA